MLNKDGTIRKNTAEKINAVLEKKASEKGIKSVSLWDLQAEIPALEKADNIVVGDVVGWVEAQFTGSFRNAKFSGFSFHYGKITKESYGADKAQHTFTIDINGVSTRKKGRTLFKEVCIILQKANDRQNLQEEKNARGKAAKKAALEKWVQNNDESHPFYEDKVARLLAIS